MSSNINANITENVFSDFNDFCQKQNISQEEFLELLITKITDCNTISKIEKVVTEHLEILKAEALSKFIQEGKKMASNLGIDTQAIVDGLTSPRTKNQQVQARYQNPKNLTETWAGRGKKPKWLVAELNNGKELQEFLIKK